jgi:hypothetical protein
VNFAIDKNRAKAVKEANISKKENAKQNGNFSKPTKEK